MSPKELDGANRENSTSFEVEKILPWATDNWPTTFKEYIDDVRQSVVTTPSGFM